MREDVRVSVVIGAPGSALKRIGKILVELEINGKHGSIIEKKLEYSERS